MEITESLSANWRYLSPVDREKDNIHNPIFGIDKMGQFCIMKSTSWIHLLFPKGVMDGEKFSVIASQNQPSDSNLI